MNVQWCKDNWPRYADSEDRDHFVGELFEEIDRLNALVANLEPNESQEIVKLLYDMTWMASLHGPSGEVGDTFIVERNYCNGTKDGKDSFYAAEGKNLLEVLRKASQNKWQTDRSIV